MNIVLLSGGSGQRLWPLSNEIRSKQFIKIFHKEDGELESMVQRVYRQIRTVDTDATVTIATSKSQVSAIHNQLGENVGISVEPCRRDTFPAIALAAAYLKDVQHIGEEEAVVICPVDPYVEDDYFKTIEALGNRAAESEANLVLMGIEPTYPSEKYGYIIPKSKENISEVSMFKEKPTAEVAEGYISQGALWNGGVFAFRLGYVLKRAHELIDFKNYDDLFAKYNTLKKISFDYAVVEHKVYGADGCQITTEAAAEILAEIEKLDIFDDVKRISFEEGFEAGKISYISEEVYTAFVEAVKKESVLGDTQVNKDVAIVYSPLNGTGLKPVIRTLKESGYTNITVVKEQEQPDGTFPTCPYPNPEVRQAMELGIEYAKKNNADLLLATDPDCDRVGIAVKNTQGEYVLLSGNETGMLLLDYICSRRTQMKTMPEDPVTVKTIVTIDMAERIAAKYGVKTINVLTGFKFIGEQIGFLEKQGKEDSYIFGMEESYGYLSGSYVRDKDGVNAAFLICEMFTYYASQGIGLFEKLNELYAEYGYCLNTLHSYTFEGSAGFEKMQNIMVSFRKSITEFAGKKVLKCLDYSEGIDGLPKSDVLKFFLEDNCSIVVRPSGTEPKLKAYISVSATTKEEAQVVEGKLARAVEEKM